MVFTKKQLRTIYATSYSLEASQALPYPSAPAVLSVDKPFGKSDYSAMTDGVNIVGMPVATNQDSIMGDTIMQDLRLGAMYNQMGLAGNLPTVGFDWFLPMIQISLPYGAPYETVPGDVIDPTVYTAFGDVEPIWDGVRATQVKINGLATVSYQSVFMLTNFESDGLGGYLYGSPHTHMLTLETAAIEFATTPYPGLPVFYTPGTSM